MKLSALYRGEMERQSGIWRKMRRLNKEMPDPAERGDKGTTHYWDELHFARFDLEWLSGERRAADPAARK